MSDTQGELDADTSGDSGTAPELPAGNGGIFGSARVFDPHTFAGGSRRGGSGGASSGTTGDTGDGGSGGEPRGNGDNGDRGPYGHGFFPNGRARKRAPRGTGATGAADRGTKTRQDGPKVSLEPATIEVVLFAVHLAASKFLEAGIPEAERVIPLETDDARKLAVAASRAARHFPMMQTSQKYADISALIIAAVTVYGPIIYLYQARKAEREAVSVAPNVFTGTFGA